MMVRDELFSEELAPAMMSVTGGRSDPVVALEMAEKLLLSLRGTCPRDTWADARSRGKQKKYEVRWRVAKADPQTAPLVATCRADAWQYAAYLVYRNNGRMTSLEVWAETPE